jgi:hypothetical protein
MKRASAKLAGITYIASVLGDVPVYGFATCSGITVEVFPAPEDVTVPGLYDETTGAAIVDDDSGAPLTA